MNLKRSDRWPVVSLALGLLLMSAGAADGRQLLVPGRCEVWLLVVRAECEIYGGLWLLCGLFPRWAWRVALTAFVGILLQDVTRAGAGYPTRDLWGRLVAGAWWVMGGDLIVVAALLRWRPSGSRAARVEDHPAQVAATALIAAAIGVAIDGSGLGQFPIIATARPGGPPSTLGLDYLVYLPAGYSLGRGHWPAILALHGAGEVGGDIARVRAAGLPRRLEAGWSLPFVVVAPQSPRQGWDVVALNALVGEALARFRLDPDRLYLTGYSMGGYGVWSLAAAYPERFAAIVPICGGGHAAWAGRLRGIPTWAFHGARDTIVAPEESRRMVAALERAGGGARLTVYPEVGHDSATPTYADPRLYEWFLAHRRGAGGSDK